MVVIIDIAMTLVPGSSFFMRNFSLLRVAIMIDGSFFIKRYRALIDQKKVARPKDLAADVFKLAKGHCHHHHNKTASYLHRIFYYDCPPFLGKAQNPISNKTILYAKTAQAQFQHQLHTELLKLRKLALRRGELRSRGEWVLSGKLLKQVITGKKSVSELKEHEIKHNFVQKMVDMKIGLDIATLAHEKQVDRIVLVAGDSDFVPAAKLARRKGIDFILDPLWSHITDSLNEHVDGIRSVWAKPS